MTRRAFALLPAFASLTRAAASTEESRTISFQPEYYHGWPTVTRRSNGELLLVYSGGRESHICPFGRVELMRSRDEGKTWSWPEVLMDSAIDDRDAGICETGSGALLVTTFTSLAYEKQPGLATERWQAVQRRSTEEQRQRLLGTWMLRSGDGGMTWSAPYRVPLNSPHGPVAVSGGRLLYAGKALWDAPSRVGVCESSNDGKTWRWLADIPLRPGDRVEDYHELHAVETADGRILVHIRNHSAENSRETLQCESKDGGKTWSAPHPIGVWGLPSHLLRLRDSRIVMTYGYRRAPFGNQARVSKDHGRTWSDPVTLSSDAAGGDVGYPSTVELSSGQLLTVWYEAPKLGRAALRMVRWSL